MENTCRGEKCPHWSGGACPFKVECWWKPGKGEPVLITDCAHIRTMLMVQDLYNRLIGVQQATEEQRNQVDRVMGLYTKLINSLGKEYVKRLEETNVPSIESKNMG